MKLAKILIIEDDPADKRMLSLFFEYNNFGNIIHYAHSISQAEAVLEENIIDLMICDVNLPDGSGIDLAHKVNDELQLDIPVVCLSGITDIEVLNRAERASVAAFVEKPLNFDLLRELMQTLDFMYLGLILDRDETEEIL